MAEVAFGIFDHLDHYDIPLPQFYEERLKLAEAADAAGLYGYHVAEHHMTPLGMAPSPGIFLAAMAQRTQRLRFGPMVYLLPLYPPLRLIEEICMLDNLSAGRLDVGVGRGISPFELAHYGVNPYEARDIFEEALEVLVSGLSNERFSFRGEHYRFRDVPMELHPLQQPYPPLWYGAANARSAEWAGRHGLNVVSGGSNAALRETMSIYREAWGKNRQASERLNPHVEAPMLGGRRHVLVADTDAEAEAIARPAYLHWYDSLVKLWRDNRTLPMAFTGDLDVARQRDSAVIGSPQTVRQEMARHIAESDCNYFSLSFAYGTLTHEQVMRSLTLFTTEVIPALS